MEANLIVLNLFYQIPNSIGDYLLIAVARARTICAITARLNRRRILKEECLYLISNSNQISYVSCQLYNDANLHLNYLGVI